MQELAMFPDRLLAIAVYHQRTSCVSSFHKNYDAWRRLANETAQREENILANLTSATSLGDLSQKLAHDYADTSSTRHEFRGMTLRDVRYEYMKIGKLFEFDALPERYPTLIYRHIFDDLRFDDWFYQGVITLPVYGTDLEKFKNSYADAYLGLTATWMSDITLIGSPKCGIGVVIRRMLTGSPAETGTLTGWHGSPPIDFYHMWD
jgi:hypothetical protein